MKSKRYCPYPVIHYNANSVAAAATSVQPVGATISESFLYSSATLPATSYYYFLADPTSVSSMPYASPGKFALQV